MSRFHFNVKYVQDTFQNNETEEERYKRLIAEYRETQKVFIDLDLILNDKYPIKRLDTMLQAGEHLQKEPYTNTKM